MLNLLLATRDEEPGVKLWGPVSFLCVCSLHQGGRERDSKKKRGREREELRRRKAEREGGK